MVTPSDLSTKGSGLGHVTRYFADQKSAPERGTLEICGKRYVLVRAASMSVEFYEVVTRLYGEEEEALAVGRSLLFDIGG